MESNFQTSFIPKRSLDETSGVKVKTPINIFFVISVIIIVVTVLLAAGVWGLKKYEERDLVMKQDQLAKEEQAIDYEAIDQVVRTSNRLKSVSALLGNHVAVSKIFSPVLEDATLQRLQFTDFAFAYLSSSRMVISMKGSAQSFETVAKQAEAFASSTVAYNAFRSSIFSNLNTDENGNVTCNFITSVNPNAISYSSTLNNQ